MPLMIRYSLITVTMFLAITVLASCSVVKFAKLYADADRSGSEGTLSGDTFSSEETSYRVGVLSDNWEQVDSGSGDIFFWNDASNATITVNSVCEENKLKYNLNALSNSLVTGIRDKEMIKRDKITVDGSDALYTEYEGIYESTRIGVATIVLKKGKCIYDFSYSSTARNFNKALEEYLVFASQFEVVNQR